MTDLAPLPPTTAEPEWRCVAAPRTTTRGDGTVTKHYLTMTHAEFKAHAAAIHKQIDRVHRDAWRIGRVGLVVMRMPQQTEAQAAARVARSA